MKLRQYCVFGVYCREQRNSYLCSFLQYHSLQCSFEWIWKLIGQVRLPIRTLDSNREQHSQSFLTFASFQSLATQTHKMAFMNLPSHWAEIRTLNAGTTIYKLGCVFPMVIFSILPHAEFGWNDYREDASHFTHGWPDPIICMEIDKRLWKICDTFIYNWNE